MTVSSYLQRRWDVILRLTVEHLLAVAIAVVIATVVGIALAVLVYQHTQLVTVVLVLVNVLFTVPALAYFGLLIVLVGLGWTSAISVLSIYALLPIVRNTITGLREVDPAIVRAAAGMGLSRRARLLQVELPLAYPVILAGVRTATVLIVGIAAIGSYVAGPGLGELIFSGLGSIGSVRAFPEIVIGTVSIVLVALVLDFALALLGRVSTPRGIR